MTYEIPLSQVCSNFFYASKSELFNDITHNLRVKSKSFVSKFNSFAAKRKKLETKSEALAYL